MISQSILVSAGLQRLGLRISVPISDALITPPQGFLILSILPVISTLRLVEYSKASTVSSTVQFVYIAQSLVANDMTVDES